MQINKQKAPKTKKTIIISAIIVALAVLGYAAFAYTNDIWPFTSSQSGQSSSEANKTSDEGSTSSDDRANEYGKKDQDEALKEGNKIQGQDPTAGSGVTDNNGKGVKNTGGIKSDSGDLTLYTPTKNQELSSGMPVTGKTSANNLHYRLSTSSKQIGLGELSVVNGKFSGTFQISGVDGGETGTFEVFNFNSRGQEINNIRIKVVF